MGTGIGIGTGTGVGGTGIVGTGMGNMFSDGSRKLKGGNVKGICFFVLPVNLLKHNREGKTLMKHQFCFLFWNVFQYC